MAEGTVTVGPAETPRNQPNGASAVIQWRHVPAPDPEAQHFAFVLATTLCDAGTEVVRCLRRAVADGLDEDLMDFERRFVPPFEPTQRELAVMAWTAEFLDSWALTEQYIEQTDPAMKYPLKSGDDGRKVKRGNRRGQE